MNTHLKTIPEFANETAEKEFWEMNDSTAYVDWKQARFAILPNLRGTQGAAHDLLDLFRSMDHKSGK